MKIYLAIKTFVILILINISTIYSLQLCRDLLVFPVHNDYTVICTALQSSHHSWPWVRWTIAPGTIRTRDRGCLRVNLPYMSTLVCVQIPSSSWHTCSDWLLILVYGRRLFFPWVCDVWPHERVKCEIGCLWICRSPCGRAEEICPAVGRCVSASLRPPRYSDRS